MKLLIPLYFLFFCSINLSGQELELIHEGFDDNEREWLIEKQEEGESRIKKGMYSIANKSKKVSRGYFNDFVINPKHDYSISTKIIQVYGERSQGYGLVWGFESWSNYVNFLINGSGQMCIYGYKNKEIFRILDWSPINQNILKNKGMPNVLKVVKKEDEIEFYINDHLVHKSGNIDIVGTKVGFKMDGEMSLAIDYIDVESLKGHINVVENPIKGYVLENLGKSINSVYCEKGQVISADGNTLYFTREDPDTNKLDDIWFSQKGENGEWLPAVNMGSPLNNEGYNSIFSITPDGNTVLLGSLYKKDGSNLDEPGVSIAHKRDGKWSIPVKVEIKGYENLNVFESFSLSADGTKLIMAAENENSRGGQDLFVSFRNSDGTWSVPQNLGNEINSFSNEFSPFIGPDGKTLFFASFGLPGYGSADIFMTKRLDDTWLNWSKPQNLGNEINSKGWDAYYQTSALGNYAYLVSDAKDASFGSCDLYRINMGKSRWLDPVVILKGTVINGKTNEILSADILYENLESDKDQGIAFSGDSSGFQIVIPKGNKYGFRAELEGYFSVSQNIDLTELDSLEQKIVNLVLIPIEKGQTILLNNLFFDIGKSTIKKESQPELDRLVQTLVKYPEMKIKITGHTDNSGSDEINLRLSTNRARAVKTYLVNKGINNNRIEYIGYGSSRPIESNETPEGRKTNRRVEFVIL